MLKKFTVTLTLLLTLIYTAQAEAPSFWDEVSEDIHAEFTEPRSESVQNEIKFKYDLEGALGLIIQFGLTPHYVSNAEDVVLRKMNQITELDDAARDVQKAKTNLNQATKESRMAKKMGSYGDFIEPHFSAREYRKYYKNKVAQAKTNLKEARRRLQTTAKAYFKNSSFASRAKLHGGSYSALKWLSRAAYLTCFSEVGIALYCAGSDDYNPPMFPVWTIGDIMLDNLGNSDETPNSIQISAEKSTKGESTETNSSQGPTNDSQPSEPQHTESEVEEEGS